MIWVLIVALVGMATMIGISLWAAETLPADARVPIHAGLSGWDSFASKRVGVSMYPVMGIAIAALTGGLELVVGGAIRQPSVTLGILTPVLVLLIAIQFAAMRSAIRASEGGDAKRVPRYVWLLVAIPVILAISLLVALVLPRRGAPTDVQVSGDRLIVSMRGPFRAFALRGRVTVRLDQLVAVRSETDARRLGRGFRKGTATRSVLAGTFTTRTCHAFWAVDDGHDAVVIDLRDSTFDRVVVEVRDAKATVAAIQRVRPDLASSDAATAAAVC